MTNSYPSGSPSVPDLLMAPRRSSYASVVAGGASGQSYSGNMRSGAFSHLLNQHMDSSFDPAYHATLSGHLRNDPRGYDMDFTANGSGHGRLSSWNRSSQLPSFSSAFGALVNGYGFAGVGGYPDHFFIPSYLKGSRYMQKLEESHKAKAAAHREGPSAHSSQPGSLSTSASSVNLHAKIVPSHRGMTYDLIEKAPPAEDENLPPLPSKWNVQDKYGPGLEILSDGQEVKLTGPKSDRDRDHEACAVRADHPMPPQCGIYYYEVTIVSRKREESSIGIGFQTRTVPLSRLPGWEPESWAYHGDDGHSFCCQSVGKAYGPPYTAGDIIGCGVNFRTGSAFFTKNGDHLGTAFRDIKGKVYPAVGMKKIGEHIRVNFGQSPFVYDIDGMMSVSSNISSSSSPPPPPSGAQDLITVTGNPGNTAQSAPSSTRTANGISNTLLNRSPTSNENRPPPHQASVPANINGGAGNLGPTISELFGNADMGPYGNLRIRNMNAYAREMARHHKTRADERIQREKAQIRLEIDATSTAKLAPPLSETELIQALVLQFLTHDGYNETARAFANEVRSEKKALSLDPNAVIEGPDVIEDEDAGHRQRIRAALLEGDIDKALKHTNAYYPQVLRENENVYFRLKCRKFVEMIRRGAEMQKASTNGSKKSNGHNGYWDDDILNHDMELDDQQGQNNWDRMDTEDSSGNQVEHNRLLSETLAYGQALQAEFKDDQRREVAKALEEIFALMAYTDPLSEKEVAHLIDPIGRVVVAEDLNSAILQSLGKSSTSALEQLLQQTTVLLEDLREGGGPGAFVNIDDFVKPQQGSS